MGTNNATAFGNVAGDVYENAVKVSGAGYVSLANLTFGTLITRVSMVASGVVLNLGGAQVVRFDNGTYAFL